MDCVALLTERVDLRDYPDYAGCIRANEFLGATLCEYYAATGMRCTVPLGYAASILYFYLYHRPRLSFADRPLSKLHHFFFPSAGYSTPLGVVGGIGVGFYQCAQDLSPARLRAITQKEKHDAVMAASQYMQRRSAAEGRLRAEQLFVSRALVALHLQADPVERELARLGLGERVSWESLLVPHGVLWTAAHSKVHDASRYKNYEGPVDAAENAPAPSSCAAAGAEKPPTEPQVGRGAYFTKIQTDALVSRAATLRSSPDEDRWMRSAGRLGAYGIFTMLLAWNSGSALFRLNMGLGLGVTVGAVASATRLDQMFAHM
ncbi:hypothetical protein ABL78_2236 [Leptomonas seymouri]|uniref:Uncharacterized protein n=1 Tax=Leptomonas seymouri TaxID=5684 RepID=A0A0N1I141_LEPSE|nr:hypothetical protein ABL78_2236 [Leptomonas seymouri]|eukprot:KPI88632.1 hypothetical protein ABL78_2236 [Leptomonas seymouri]